MRTTFAIFRKDAGHLWPHITAFLTVMTMAAVLDPTYTHRGPSEAYALLSSGVLPLACWNLLIALIHEEKLTGDRQYWLTRPISWKALLAAKALFAVAFINLPLFLYHAGAYLAVGVPVGEHLPDLLWRQVFFSAFYIMPVAALAATTRSLGQIVLAALFVVPLGGLSFRFYPAAGAIAWRGLEWELTSAIAAILALGAGAILILQYSARRTGLSRSIGAAAIVLIVAALISSTHSTYRTSDDYPIHVDFDSAHARVADSVPWVVSLQVPLRISGAPPGVELFRTGVSVSLERGSAALGTSSMSYVSGKVSGEESPGGAYIAVDIGRGLFDAVKDVPIDVRGTVQFILIGGPRTFPVPRAHRVAIPRVGACSTEHQTDPRPQIAIVCYTPDARASLAVGHGTAGFNWIIPRGFVNLHIPTSSDFQPLTRYTSQFAYESEEQLDGLKLIASEPLAEIRRTFEFHQVRLSNLPRTR